MKICSRPCRRRLNEMGHPRRKHANGTAAPVVAEDDPSLNTRFGQWMTVRQLAGDMRVSVSQVYRIAKNPELGFPTKVHLGANTTRWRTEDYKRWVRALSK